MAESRNGRWAGRLHRRACHVTLTLEIITAPTMPSVSLRTFRENGGRIGREKGNDWVLPHNKVSGRHAVITYRSGTFYIEDQSRNGVFLNSKTDRLPPGRPQPLQSGDCLFIEPYEIQVTVAEDDPRDLGFASPGDSSRSVPDVAVPRDDEVVDPMELLGGEMPTPESVEVVHARRRGVSSGHAHPTPQPSPRSAAELEMGAPLAGHYKLPPVAAPPPEPSAGRTSDSGRRPSAADPFKDSDPFATPGAPHAIPPPNYDPLLDRESSRIAPLPPPAGPPPIADVRPSAPPDVAAPSPAASPIPRMPTPTPPSGVSKPAVPPSGPGPVAPARSTPAESPAVAKPAGASKPSTLDVAAILESAGLGSVEVTPEVAESLGRIFRVVVTGVMDILSARQQIKDEFRMRQTQFRPADNNPLKFAANVDHALRNLFVDRNPAYLPPVDAFTDAFDDLRDHQLAMLAGLRVAFESMLAEFDPDQLEAQFDRQFKRGALIKVPAKLRYWEAYRDKSQQLLKDVDATFRRWFGEEFVKAYEEQLERLEAERRETPR
jgi:type VI secretion system FHA domain protein